ncbi:MAG: hypothetical protein VB031_03625 [Eubacteriaceae bacterium]|nr:hypothetical protein [Eubacteriaceae bacterium]
MVLTVLPATAFADADYAGLKTRIEVKVFSYAAAESADTDEKIANSLKAQFANQLWDIVFHDYKNTFADQAAVETATTVTNDNSKLGVTTDGGTDKLDCYKVSVALGDKTTAVGYIYKMPSAEQILIKGTKNGTATYYLKTLGTRDGTKDPAAYPDVNCILDYGKYDQDNKDIDVGGARIAGTSGSTDYCVSLHMVRADESTFQLFIYKPDFEGAIANGSGTDKAAAAWNFGNTPFVAFNNTTSADPFPLVTYFGYSSITIAPMSGMTIDSITSDLPDKAVTISENKVTFNSSYYDSVPLKIEYTYKGQQKTGYVSVKRVGIDIQEYRQVEGNTQCQTNHGTQEGITFDWGKDNCAVYATYYYPGTKTTDIDLYCTYTWANGSVTTDLLTDNTYTAGNEIFTATDDFCVYKGSAQNKPVKVSIIGVKAGAFENDNFGGATIGAGTGVTWPEE